MTRDRAVKLLQRLAKGATGAKGVRIEVEHWTTGVSSPERRAAASQAFARVSADLEAARAEYDRIIREHADLQRLAALRKTLSVEKSRLNLERFYYKFAAYLDNGFSLSNPVAGDTWEDAIAQAETKWATPRE